MTNRLRLAAIGTLALYASELPSQRLRGQVLLPDSVTPAAGVIVVAAADNGNGVLRTLTSQNGRFDLRVPRPARYKVSALRVGFQPTVGPILDLVADETRIISIVLGRDAIALARVTVRGQDYCRTRPDTGALVARAWEEARKALMASQLSTADTPLSAQWIVYERSLDAQSGMIRERLLLPARPRHIRHQPTWIRRSPGWLAARQR